jgi:heme oxygenase
MKKYALLAAAFALTSPLAAFAGQSAAVDKQIAEAVKILPEDLRAGATVVTYDAATGARKVLRQGTNFLECQPRMADGFTRCYSKTLAPRRDFEAKLRAQKKTDEEISKAVAAAQADGTLPKSSSTGMMSYRGYDKRDRIQDLWVISLPNRTPESVGVSTVSQRDAALEGKGLPWMMLPGTPGAHIMIPINPPAKNSAITDVAPDEITQATLPLPEDMRAGATVYKYDQKTGERIVLRKGTSAIECTPRGADGFTWCYNAVTGPRRDFAAKLRAQGKSDKEIQDAVAAATQAGTLKPAPFGTMSYRLYGKKDRIQLLWVLSVPGATPESIGVSEGSQRDEAINNGNGRPWLMLPGQPGAHIMIPINK